VFRSLRARLVLFMLLLIVLMMSVVGTFLINSVARFQLENFVSTMSDTFSNNEDFAASLYAAADQGADAPARLKEVLRAFSGVLGIDTGQRNYYILDAVSGAFLDGSDQEAGERLALTPTILRAMSTKSPQYSQRAGDPYLDVAVPVGPQPAYIVYIKDTKDSMQALIIQLFTIIVEALVVGLLFACLLSFVFSKAITMPLEDLTRGATLMASGDFTHELTVRSTDEIGVLTGTFNHMADVLRRTLEEVGSERDKLGTLFLHMKDGVAAFSEEGCPIQANPAAETMLGIPFDKMCSYDEVLGRLAPLGEVLSVGQPRVLQREYVNRGRTLQVSLAPFGGADAEGVMAVIHDVTEQKKLDEMRREFVSNVSHELRTPLTNIRSYAETLSEAEDLPHDTARSFSQVILNEAERMSRIVRDLLTLSRFDYGKMDWHFEPCPLADVLKNTYDAMRMEARKKGHDVTLEFVSMLPDIVADRARIEQVIVNVLSNAIKYTPDGGRIEMAAGAAGDGVWVSVKDNGIGVPPEDMPRLFERFYRVDRARSRQSGGTGLGLSIAREIVDAHGGEIQIDSTLGEGTCVTVRLPLRVEP
jgi:two-component system sensor histidine kinase VicK